MYEHHTAPLLTWPQFLRRLGRHSLAAAAIIVMSLGVGVLGYHGLEGLSWLDALLNASMILGGMGPVDVLHTESGKLFASFYALYSGVAFLVTAGVMVAPVAHRLLHRLHLVEGAE
jgi:hypothetical protein